MARMKIEKLEGIGPVNGQKLRAAGIETTDTLLEAGRTRKGRAALAETTGIGEKTLLSWINMVDLCRVSGIGPEFAELLEAAGVDTTRELCRRNAESLAARCAEVNAQKKLTRRVPSAQVVAGWIESAGKLPPCIEY